MKTNQHGAGPKGPRPFIAVTSETADNHGVFYDPEVHGAQHPDSTVAPKGGKMVLVDSFPTFGEAVKAAVMLNKALTRLERGAGS